MSKEYAMWFPLMAEMFVLSEERIMAEANPTIFVSPELVIQLETDLHSPSMVRAQPVLIYMTAPSSRGPNFSRDERNVGRQKWVAKERLQAIKRWAIDHANRLLCRIPGLQGFT
jgi:hypothetical protein